MKSKILFTITKQQLDEKISQYLKNGHTIKTLPPQLSYRGREENQIQQRFDFYKNTIPVDTTLL